MKIKELFKKNSNGLKIEKLMSDSNTSKDTKVYSKAYRVEEINKNLKEKKFKISDLGAYTFKQTLFKDELRTPHFEIQKSLENYEEIPEINSGINQIMLFITGNDIKITSEDEYTQKWWDKWLEQRPDIFSKVKEIILQCEICGNSWIEPVWDIINETEYMNDFGVIPDPSRIYYNLSINADLENQFWIFQVPYIFRKYGDMDIKQFAISYVKNGIAWQEVAYGIGLKKKDLIHIKTGWSRYGYYGRSYLASTINSAEIITQMLKNYAIASRYMAFGKKVFSVGDENNPADIEDTKKLTRLLNEPEDEEHVVVNKKIEATEITPTQFNEMSNGLEYNRKEISSGLLPNFMTPWSDTVTYASSTNAKIPFELSLENKRVNYIKLLNENILENVAKQNPKLKNATFEFGEVTLDDSKDVQQSNLELYNNNVITLNQLLKVLGMDTVKNGDIYKSERDAMFQQKMQEQQEEGQEEEEEYEESFEENFEESFKEKNKDVESSKFDAKAQAMYDWLKRAYEYGYRKVKWVHNPSENPRLYHIKKNGKIYNIKDMLDKKIEFPGWAKNCKCTGELVKTSKIKK